MKFAHTNIICRDLDKIVGFYTTVFGCRKLGNETKMSGEWLEKGTQVKNAEARSINLELPGYDSNGPILEIFQYKEIVEDQLEPFANRKGFGHIAFKCENVKKTLDDVLSNGGCMLGELVEKEFKTGTFTYAYILDPEKNIIEIQSWNPKI